MKIVYFIMLHHKFYQFRWLFEAIHSTDDLYLIHVDRKSDPKIHDEVRDYVSGKPNVTIMRSRSVVYRGWSQVQTELDAIRDMLSTNREWRYFINLSGQDYPIRPPSVIKERMHAEWPKIFIRVWPFETIRQTEPHDPHLTHRFAFEAFGRLIRTRIPLPSPAHLAIDFKGSNFHFLTRDFCEWLVASPMTQRVKRYLGHVPTADEVFFQGLIMNSPFRDLRTADYVPFQIWPGVKILGMEDYEHIIRSDSLFARKFDAKTDSAILNRLATELGFRTPAGATVSV